MIARTPSRPRKTTLAMAITRPIPPAPDSQAARDSAEPAAAADSTSDGEAGARRGGEPAGVMPMKLTSGRLLISRPCTSPRSC